MTSAAPPAEGILTKTSPRGVGDTVNRLREILDSNGLTVFAAIDQRAEAHRVGLDLRETTLVIFGSPTAGTPVMDYAPLAALDLPLKVLVWDDGGLTRVSYVAPSELVARYGLTPQLEANLAGIDAVTDALVASDAG